MANNRKELNIWDLDSNPPNSFKEVLFWKNSNEKISPNTVLMSDLLKEFNLSLRSSYLEYLHEIGNRPFNGKSIIENLKIRKNFSYW